MHRSVHGCGETMQINIPESDGIHVRTEYGSPGTIVHSLLETEVQRILS